MSYKRQKSYPHVTCKMSGIPCTGIPCVKTVRGLPKNACQRYQKNSYFQKNSKTWGVHAFQVVLSFFGLKSAPPGAHIPSFSPQVYTRRRPDSATETGYHKYIIRVLRATILYSISVYLTCQKYNWRTCVWMRIRIEFTWHDLRSLLTVSAQNRLTRNLLQLLPQPQKQLLFTAVARQCSVIPLDCKKLRQCSTMLPLTVSTHDTCSLL